MSACDTVQPLLAEWIANELDGAEAADVRAHLAECAMCRTEEAEMREVLALLESDAAADGLGGIANPGEPYWAGFASRVSANVAPRRAKTAPAATNVVRLFDRAPRVAVAALAAAALVVLALRMPWPTTPGDPDTQLAALLASPAAEGIGEMIAPSASDLASLAPDDLDRLGEKLVAAEESDDDLDDLSPEQLDELLQLLDATET